MKRLLVSLVGMLAWIASATAQPMIPGVGSPMIPNATSGSGGGSSPIVPNTTLCTGCTANGVLYSDGTKVQSLATANSGVLVTSAGGAPSISTTLPSGLTIPGFAPVASPTFTGVVTTGTINASAGNPGIRWGGGSAILSPGNGGADFLTITNGGNAVFLNSIQATLASATGTNVVCNTPGTSTALTVQVFATGCVASSADYKQNIRPIARSTAFDIVMAMQAVQYEYRPDQNLDDDEHVGFTAQQIASIPTKIDRYDMITYRADGKPHAVKYNEMAPLFAAAIQQLKADNDSLRADIEGLRQSVAR